MENILMMNRLPLPPYYDGKNWNTVFKPTRRSIPKYLHEDLPELKLIELKERFKQIGKFNCPRLDYFDSYIRNHKTTKDQKTKRNHSNAHRDSYQQLKEQFQYALLLCDKKSPVLDQLVNRAKTATNSKTRKKQQKGRYFEGTIDLVFRNKKQQYLSQQKHGKQAQLSETARSLVDKIKLIQFN